MAVERMADRMPQEALVELAQARLGQAGEDIRHAPWRPMRVGRWTKDMAAVCLCREVRVVDAALGTVGAMAHPVLVAMEAVEVEGRRAYVGRCPRCGTVYWDQEGGADGGAEGTA